MKRVRYLLVFTGFLTLHMLCQGQNDTIPSYIKGKTVIPTRVTDTLPAGDNVRRKGHKASPYAVDSLARKQHDPRKATIRSAIFPGLGQIYNHKYWKLPLVYAAVGIPAVTYFYNRSWYRKCQFALAIIDNYQAAGLPGTSIPDSILAKVNPILQPFVLDEQDNTLRTARNEYRKNEDYSVLFFLLFWGLNVVDATVDAHLMYFDVSDQLSMHLQQPSPGFLAPGSSATGLSLVFDFHKPRYKMLPMP
jgi:hypothetical protein